MEDVLLYWFLAKFAKHRGYILSPEERRKYIPFTEEEMIKKYNDYSEKRFEEWQKEQKQEEEN